MLHLVQFIRSCSTNCLRRPATQASHGAGKSYHLGFVLYDLVSQGGEAGGVRHPETRRAGATLAQAGRGSASSACSFSTSPWPDRPDSRRCQWIDVVTPRCTPVIRQPTTPSPLRPGRNAPDAMALVPCCQAEVARALQCIEALNLSRTPLAELCSATAAHPRTGASAHQRAALPVSGGQRLPGHRDRNSSVGAQPEEQADPRPLHRPAQASAAERLHAILEEFGLQALAATRCPRRARPEGSGNRLNKRSSC